MLGRESEGEAMVSARRLFLASLAVAALSLEGVLIPPVVAPASALSSSEFNPEMIISDELFYDGNAMTASQIQTFLDGKIGTCLSDRCLNVAVLPVASRAASYSADTGGLVCSAISGGSMRVSELIYRVQVACGISAKVILVTLQKEQGLVTSRAPSDWALRAAMGMGCPDTAPCSDAFAGLANQIISGTRQLNVYKVGRFGRQPGVQYIQYNPDPGCLGTTINVRNYATAALYNYTPYQPNAAALANLAGVGDSCSSYGNRNFWRFYRDWFGSVAGAQYMVSTADVDYLIARDASNELFGYPVEAGGGWGLRTSLGAGWAGVTDLIGVGDLDNNGFRDVVARDAQGRSWFYPGDGALSYPTRRQLAVDWSSAARVLYGGNVNPGRDPDMLTVDTSGVLWLWAGDGAGGLGGPVEAGRGFGSYAVLTGVGDFTGDRCGDLLGITNGGVLTLHAGDCSGGFQSAREIAWGLTGYTDLVAPGDFNGDGRADVWAKDSSGTMHLYRGTGGGTVAATSTIDMGWGSMQNVTGAGSRPSRPATITNVASTDDMYAGYLIARDAADALWAYPANGSGGWASRVSLGRGWGGVTDLVGVGDLDGNGFRDVIARDAAGRSWFYPGDGRLDYPRRVGIDVDWSSARRLIYGGYVNGDVAPDMLTVDGDGALWLWPGDGAGGFGARVRAGSGFGSAVSVAGVGDFDGDRCGDLVSLTSSGALMLHRSDCAGTFRSPTQIASGLASYRGVYSHGDFTDDGVADLWVMDSEGAIRLFRGTGGGAVAATSTRDLGWGSFTSLTGAGMAAGAPTIAGATKPSPGSGEEPQGPGESARGQTGVGDVDGDGRRDILGVTSSGDLKGYYGDGAGGIGRDGVLVPGWGKPGLLQFPLGDFTGDGRPDLGIITGAGEFLIARGRAGGFEPPTRLATGWAEFDSVIGALDWDGDGNSDVIARSRAGDLWLYRGDGRGGWATNLGSRLGKEWGGYKLIPAGDFDGSGTDDLLALQGNGDLWLYRGDGKGGWATLMGTRVGTGWSSFVSVFSPGDFDGSGGTDLLARTSDGRLLLYPGNGSGGFRSPRQIDAGWQTFGVIF